MTRTKFSRTVAIRGMERARTGLWRLSAVHAAGVPQWAAQGQPRCPRSPAVSPVAACPMGGDDRRPRWVDPTVAVGGVRRPGARPRRTAEITRGPRGGSTASCRDERVGRIQVRLLRDADVLQHWHELLAE